MDCRVRTPIEYTAKLKTIEFMIAWCFNNHGDLYTAPDTYGLYGVTYMQHQSSCP